MNEEERARKREWDRKYRLRHPDKIKAKNDRYNKSPRRLRSAAISSIRKLKQNHPRDFKRLMRELRYDLRKAEAEESFNQARGLGECYG